MMANSGKYVCLSYWMIITQSVYATNTGADSSEMQFVWVQKSMLLKMFCEFNYLFNDKIFLICGIRFLVNKV